MNFTRISIASLNKKSLKDIVNVVNDETVRLPSHFKYIWGYIATRGTIKSKLYKSEWLKVTKKPPDDICHFQFSEKGIQLINLSSIFNNNSSIFH